MNGHRDLVVAAQAAVLCAVVVLVAPIEAIRLAAALPLCLALPGYAITAAAFGARPPGPVRLLPLSIALSLATLALGSLVLNYVPGGLREGSWTALLVLVVAGGCFVAAQRRPRGLDMRLPRLRAQISRRNRVLLLGAAVSIAAALALAWQPQPAKHAVGYTQLWMQPAGDAAAAVRIGVASAEQEPVDYELEVRVSGRRAPFTSRLTLEPGQERVLRVPIVGPSSGGFRRIDAQLFRRDNPDSAYRQVNGWIPGA